MLNLSNIKIGDTINLECFILKKSFFSSKYHFASKQIKITKDRKIFTSDILNYICIELFESDDIIDFFKIEPQLFKQNKDYFKNNEIFLLRFFDGNKVFHLEKFYL